MSQLQTVTPAPPVKTERILVVKRSDLFQESAWTGMKSVDFEKYLKLIQEKRVFGYI